jgi:hypothetical protein
MPQPSPAMPPPRTVRTPKCEVCHTPMKLKQVEPHQRYINFDEWTYACPCGAIISRVIAHKS